MFYFIRTHRSDSKVRRLHVLSKLSASLSRATERLWAVCCGRASRLADDVVDSDSMNEDADDTYAERRCDTEKEFHTPTMETVYGLDSGSRPEESSESEYELSSDDQTDCDSQQCVDEGGPAPARVREPGKLPNPMVQAHLEC
jgi:hypothetical protein